MLVNDHQTKISFYKRHILKLYIKFKVNYTIIINENDKIH